MLSSCSGQGVFLSCVGRSWGGSCTGPRSFLPTHSFCACCFTGRALAVQSGDAISRVSATIGAGSTGFYLSPTSGIWLTAYVAVKMRVRLGEESRENKPPTCSRVLVNAAPGPARPVQREARVDPCIKLLEWSAKRKIHLSCRVSGSSLDVVRTRGGRFARGISF